MNSIIDRDINYFIVIVLTKPCKTNLEVNSMTIERKKCSIWYKYTNGFKNDPIEVFIHGDSAPSIWLQKTVDKRISEGKATLVFDLPGHGRSSKANDYYLDTMVSAVINILEASGVVNDTRGYNIIAWSYGGNIAIHALDEGKLPNLKNLVLVGNPPLSSEENSLPEMTRIGTFATNVIENTYNLVKDLSKNQIEQLATSFLCHNNNLCEETFIPKNLLLSVSEVDGKVRSDIVESFSKGMFKDEIIILQDRPSGVKLHFLYGIYDALLNPEYIIHVAKRVRADSVIPLTTGHAAMFENPFMVSNKLNQCFINKK